MTIESQLEDLSSKLKATDEEEKIIKNRLATLEDYLSGHDNYKVANIWRTTPVTADSSVGKYNQTDAITLIHTSVSEREHAEMFYKQLNEVAVSDFINKAVSIEIDDIPMNVLPTKFAQQGTIEINDTEFPLFADIVGVEGIFEQASRILQHWQAAAGLDLERQALLPSEIEIALAHAVKEGEPDSLLELLQMFFKYGKAERFATQLNIFDRHGNILLNYNFIIPDKQVFLEKLFDAHDKLVQGEPDLSVFGI